MTETFFIYGKIFVKTNTSVEVNLKALCTKPVKYNTKQVPWSKSNLLMKQQKACLLFWRF